MNSTQSNTPHAAGEAAHTPTPWRAVKRDQPGRGTLWRDIVSDGLPFSPSYVGEAIENDAAFIVRACNSHAALVALAEAVSRKHPGPGGIGDQARAALAQAKATP